jgi:spore coat polysaccharide biosynthesis protein SpsF
MNVMHTSDPHPRTVAIIQARMGSSRLPGKVLKDIEGEPMLVREVTRVRRAGTLDEVVVATTTEGEDDPVAELCRRRGYSFYRGSLFDVLDRYYRAAQQFSARVVVRLTADCPLIDPAAIDQTANAFFAAGVDFAANRLPEGRTVPIGFDTEVCTFAALERAWREARQPYEREHVMPYLYNTPGRFRTLLVKSEPDHGSLRWTVDTAEDLELVRAVYARFPGRDDFTYQEMLDLFTREPDLAQINAGVRHKGFQDVDKRHPA